MKHLALLLPLLLLTTACQTLKQSLDAATNIAGQFLVPDSTLYAMGFQMAQQMDGEQEVAPNSSAYVERVNRMFAEDFVDLSREDSPYDVKVYLINEVNAFALPDGSIRIYSGLLDLYEDDDELRFVIAHEVGHVMLGHSRQQLTRAMGLQYGQDWLTKQGGAAAYLGSGTSGAMLNKLITAQFSQQDEQAADDFALALFFEKKYDAGKTASALRKLAQPDRGGFNLTILASHPEPESRAQRLDAQIVEAGAVTGSELSDYEEAARRLAEQQNQTDNAITDHASKMNASEDAPGIDLRWVQQTLNALGYTCGTADGVMGKNTRACIKAFQQDEELPATGKLTEATVALMRAR